MAPIRKTATLATALALAAALMPAPALAADGDRVFWSDTGPNEFPLEIDAAVAVPEPVVIRVEVPSSSSVVAVQVETSVVDGRFLGFTAGECRVRNLPESTVPISAAVSKVVDGAGGAARALGFLDVSLTADNTVYLQEGEGRNDVLVESLAPGVEAAIAVGVEDGSEGGPIPDGAYATSATVKVAAA